MRECKICGSGFDPKTKNQVCCSKKCMEYNGKYLSRVSYFRRKGITGEIPSPRVRGKFEQKTIYCLICGQPVERGVTPHGRTGSKKLHEECVKQDALKTILSGKPLSGNQLSRLYGIGLTQKELIEAYRNREI